MRPSSICSTCQLVVALISKQRYTRGRGGCWPVPAERLVQLVDSTTAPPADIGLPSHSIGPEMAACTQNSTHVIDLVHRHLGADRDNLAVLHRSISAVALKVRGSFLQELGHAVLPGSQSPQLDKCPGITGGRQCRIANVCVGLCVIAVRDAGQRGRQHLKGRRQRGLGPQWCAAGPLADRLLECSSPIVDSLCLLFQCAQTCTSSLDLLSPFRQCPSRNAHRLFDPVERLDVLLHLVVERPVDILEQGRDVLGRGSANATQRRAQL